MARLLFPPKEFASFDRASAGRLLRLLHVLKTEPVVLILGAGVSASSGLPTWNELMSKICQIFFYHWQFQINHGWTTVVRPPRKLSIAFTEPEGDNILALGADFARDNPVLAAQQIKNCIRDLDWIWLVRKCLYGEFDSKETHHSLLIDRLNALHAAGCVQAIVNYNYDSVFEDFLSAQSVRYKVLYDSQQQGRPGFLPIYHVHGYLKRGGGPKTTIVLAEDDYHQQLDLPYSWANLLQSSFLIGSTCLFVGTSLTDPNLRRLLRSAFAVGRRFHYALLPANLDSPKDNMLNALFDADLHGLGVESIRYPREAAADPPHASLPRTLDLLLKFRNRSTFAS
jgi:hypothetical protein